MSHWLTVCPIKQLHDSVGVCAKIHQQQVAIFHSLRAKKLFAIHNFDPFCRANVLSRGLIGTLQGQWVIASPMYKQHFNLETGQCLEDPNIWIPVYEVREHEGQIEVRSPS